MIKALLSHSFLEPLLSGRLTTSESGDSPDSGRDEISHNCRLLVATGEIPHCQRAQSQTVMKEDRDGERSRFLNVGRDQTASEGLYTGKYQMSPAQWTVMGHMSHCNLGTKWTKEFQMFQKSCPHLRGWHLPVHWVVCEEPCVWC